MTPDPARQSLPRWRPSLRIYLILMNVVLLCLLFPTISIFYYKKTVTFRDEQLQRAVSDRTAALHDKAAQLVRSISYNSTDAIAGYNFTFLNTLVFKAVSSDPEFIGCYISSANSPDSEAAGYGFKVSELQAFKETVRRKAPKGFPFPQMENDSRLLDVVYLDIHENKDGSELELLTAIAPVYVGGKLWGTIAGTFSLDFLSNDIASLHSEWTRQFRHYQTSFFTITCIFLGLGIASAIFLTRPLLRTIHLLREGVERVSSGNLTHKIMLDGLACDEFASLSDSFNNMTNNLRLARQQLDDYSHSLEMLVRERTKELEQAQAELVISAHEAGMAEMAVGVLHNIGNAITPVKVATEVLIKKLRNNPLRTNLQSTLSAVPRAMESCTAMSDADKNKISTILSLLPQGIRDEFDHIIREIEQISEKHKYIENIISLQMNYARLKGRDEEVDINQVARDSLEMLAEIIQKHDIQVETSLQAEAKVWLEEGKLLQILINLIKNGCEAMSGMPDGTKHLLVTTSHTEGETPEVVLSVQDTGRGFTPEEKKKFFTFGFSTKDRGSGFGLHSSANYLIANNGTIEANSDGPGRGAAFIIRLPSASKRNEQS